MFKEVSHCKVQYENPLIKRKRYGCKKTPISVMQLVKNRFYSNMAIQNTLRIQQHINIDASTQNSVLVPFTPLEFGS